MSACGDFPPGWFSFSREDPLIAAENRWRFINVPVFWSRVGLERGLHFQFHASPLHSCACSLVQSDLNSPDCTLLFPSPLLSFPSPSSPSSPLDGGKGNHLYTNSWEGNLGFPSSLYPNFSNKPPFQSPVWSQPLPGSFSSYNFLGWIDLLVFLSLQAPI